MEAQRLVPFLLLICIGGTDCHLVTKLMIRMTGRSVRFEADNLHVAYYYVLYNVSAEGDLLVFNTSQPGGSHPKAGRVSFHGFPDNFFELTETTLSDSGEYRLEGRLCDSIAFQRNYTLIVCPDARINILQTPLNRSVQLCGADSKGESMTTIQLYRLGGDSPDMLILDTTTSMEQLPEDLRGRLQVDPNSSSVTLHGVTEDDYYQAYECVTFQSGQCQSSKLHLLDCERFTLYPRQNTRLTLPCNIKPTSPHQVYWTTPSGNVTLSPEDSSQAPPSDSQQEEKMYMLNGSQTGDYSLIIPSVKQHGKYICNHKKRLVEYEISMCWQFKSTTATFSNNETVKLDCGLNYEVQWFRQRGADTEELILDSENKTVLLPEDLSGRVDTSSLVSLVIANPRAEDSGVYTCRVKLPNSESFKPALCLEHQFRLHYEDPYGIHSLSSEEEQSADGAVPDDLEKDEHNSI
ncbi:hypothetical protein ACEWY4_008773 [Coilia grayii]|uniref:Ig-like domain-containing protein n=1 Tax=Coilia grayii TaxID=363190 RepID=A0ABD1KBS3_9TELE